MHYILYYGALPFCIKNLSKSERYVKIILCIVMAYIVGYRQHSFTEQEEIIMGFVIENGVLIKYTEEPGVTEVVIPDGVTIIGGYSFSECEMIKSVVIGNGVTYIDEGAFSNCTGLESIVISESVTSIGEIAFSDCGSLTSVVIPESVTSIGEGAFHRCTSLSSVIIPAELICEIGDAFWGCSKLKNLPAFGYVINGTKCDFQKTSPFIIMAMLDNMDFSMRMHIPTKYQFVAQVFLKDSQPEAEAYIKKNISKILPYFIDIDDYATVKGLLESGKFVTKKNIKKFIEYAKEHTQNSGNKQIQDMLTKYKSDHFPE